MLYLQLWLDIMSFMESAPESSSSSVNLKTKVQILSEEIYQKGARI